MSRTGTPIPARAARIGTSSSRWRRGSWLPPEVAEVARPGVGVRRIQRLEFVFAVRVPFAVVAALAADPAGVAPVEPARCRGGRVGVGPPHLRRRVADGAGGR